MSVHPILNRGPWGLLCALALMFGPTIQSLAHGAWLQDRQSHGPVMALVACWLFWHRLTQAGVEACGPSARVSGWSGILVGLCLYAIGRSQVFQTIEVFALLPLCAGVTLLVGGTPLLRHLSFCHFFLIFLVPVPGQLADALTNPLKIAVSYAAECILSLAEYNVARSGVILYLPPYKLMVADACSGLSSLFMLEAFGLLYLNVVKHTSLVRNAVLSVMIMPIAFIANVIRVLLLAMVTLHWGDETASGFFHSFSGLVLFLPSLVLIAVLDAVLRRLVKPPSQPERKRLGSLPCLAAPAQWALVGGAVITSAAALALRPPALLAHSQPPGLSQAILPKFANWHAVDGPVQVNSAVAERGQRTTDQPYDEVVARTYQNARGTQVMLTVAYAYEVQQEVKIHRPEVCYSAQGFKVVDDQAIKLPLPPSVPTSTFGARRMLAIQGTRREAVIYWIRVGRIHADGALQTRLHILAEGLQGRISDGVLVRVSTLLQPGRDVADAMFELTAFLQDLHDAVGAESGEVGQLLWWGRRKTRSPGPKLNKAFPPMDVK